MSTSTQPAAVLAIVAETDRAEWLDAALRSLAALEYPRLEVVVLTDGGVTHGVRVEELLPSALVLDATGLSTRHTRDYAEAVNNVCAAVPGADYLLLLRDGVTLEPDALRILVADAVESGAGVVGPKLLDRARPEILADVGGTVDRLGVFTPAAEPGELDQSQHNEARDAFVAPAGAMLVRTDLFTRVGGFDKVMGSGGDHMDLCWRVQMYAQRVRVLPSAVGYQPVTTEPVVRRLAYRHRIRTMAKCYGWVHLLPALFMAVVAAFVEFAYALVRGRFGHAGDVATAWGWNLHHAPSLLRLRRKAQRQRLLRDATLRQRHSLATRRVGDWTRAWLSSAGDLREMVTAPGGALSTDRLSEVWMALAVWASTLGLLAFGSRHLLSRGVAGFGQFASFADPGQLIEAYLGGWREVGAGVSGVGSTALGLLSVAAVVSFGAVDLLRHVLIMGLLPLGLVGIWWLTGVAAAGSKARLIAVVLYAVNPLPYDALGTGAWDVLLIYAVLPFALALMIGFAGEHTKLDSRAQASDQAQAIASVRSKPSEMRRRATLARIARLALLLGVVAAFEPLVLLLVPLAAAVIAVVAVLHRQVGTALAVLGWTFAASIIAGLLNLVWVLEFGSVVDYFATALADPAVTEPHGLADLLRFELGTTQVAWLGWGLLLAAVAAVLGATQRRVLWTFTGVGLAAFGFALAWSGERGWLDAIIEAVSGVVLDGSVPSAAAVGRLALVVALTGCCLTVAAGAVGLQMLDRPSSEVGTDPMKTAVAPFQVRRVALVLIAVGVTAAALPTLLAARSGEWNVTEFDLEVPLSSVDDHGVGPSYRVLWIGRPEVLPLTGRSLTAEVKSAEDSTVDSDGAVDSDEAVDSAVTTEVAAYAGLHIATSVRGYPDVRSRWPGPITSAERRLGDAVRIGLNGETLRMGRLLGAFGVRYVVVIDRSAPSYSAGWDRPAPKAALEALESQIDLLPVATDKSVHVFRNEAWWSSRSQFIPAIEPNFATSQLELAVSDLTRGVAVLTDNRSVTDQSGQIGIGQVLVAEAFDSGWYLDTEAGPVAPDLALGWAMSFDSPAEGSARLRFERPIEVARAALAQLLLWASVLWLALGQPTPFVDRLCTRRVVQRATKNGV